MNPNASLIIQRGSSCESYQRQLNLKETAQPPTLTGNPRTQFQLTELTDRVCAGRRLSADERVIHFCEDNALMKGK